MGALNPLLTSLLPRDSLQGRDRDGLFSATATGPVRYDDDGLIVEPAVTNYVRNPIAGTGTTSIGGTAQSSVDRVTSLPAPLPGWLGPAVTTGILVTCTSSAMGNLALFSADPASAIPHTIQAHVWLPSALSATGIALRVGQFAGVTPVDYPASMALRDQWQPVIGAFTPDAGDLSGNVIVRVTDGTMQVGEQIWVTVVAMQPESVATSPAVGSIGPGYSWASTPHNSASTRALTVATIPVAGHLDTVRGSVVARVKLHYDTDSHQRVLSAGSISSNDYLSLNARDGNNDNVRLTSVIAGGTARDATNPALTVGQAATLYGEWETDTLGLAINEGAKTTANRVEVPTGSVTGADIAIGSTGTVQALGGSLSDLLIYDAALSDARRALVLDALDNEATEDELWGLFAGNPYTFFQLRPY